MGCYRKYLWKILLIFGKIKLFLEKKKAVGNPTVCARIHMYAYAHLSHAYACLRHVHECMDMRTQLTNAWTCVRN